MSDYFEEQKAELDEGNKILDLEWNCPNRKCPNIELFDRKTGYYCTLCHDLLEIEYEVDLFDSICISDLKKQNCGLLKLTLNEIYNYTIEYNEAILEMENYRDDVLNMD